MWKNYLTIARRSLWKQKGYAAINVLGLAVGLAGCLLILLFVWDEWRYDRHHENADRIVRLAYTAESGGNVTAWAYSGADWGRILADELPEVVTHTRLAGSLGDEATLVRYGDEVFAERGIYFADSTLFDVFTLPLLRGDPATALNAPSAVILSATTARKYFGADDALGETLLIDGDPFRVTGIFADQPSSTHLPFDLLVSFATLYQANSNYDQSLWAYTYLLLDEPGSVEVVAAKLPAFIEAHVPRTGFLAGLLSLDVQPLTSLHLRSHRQGEPSPGGNVTTLFLCGVIALLILVVACINFMNLATARASGRAREVGMRKTLGAKRRQIVGQFLGEAILLCALATLAALVLGQLFLPVFNAIAGKSLSVGVLAHPAVLLGLPVLVVLVGMAAGSYPAFVLSRFRPAAVLKGSARGATSKARLRQVLVVGQFVVSIVLLAGTGVIYQQIQFLRDKDLGFQKEQLLTVPLSGTTLQQADTFEPFRNQLLQNTAIEAVTSSSNRLGERIWIWNYRPEGWQGEEEYWTLPALHVDEDYLETYGMHIVAGRGFSRAHPGDVSDAILINESAARFLGWDDPVGKTMTMPPAGETPPQTVTVLGVVQDFNFASLHQEVAPIILDLNPLDGGLRRYLTVRVRTDDVPGALAHLEQVWQTFDAEHTPQIAFADAQFAQLYAADRSLGRIVWAFACFAVVVACLGLLGLISFTAEQRRQEIGVRKVLGASVGHIVTLLSGDFLKLVSIAFVLAVPLAYVATQWWLGSYAYRVGLGPGMFMLAGVAVFTLAFLTVAYHAVRAALVDPVESLRYE